MLLRGARASRARVCLVVGAGAGIGVHVARRFAKEGFVACLCRRSDRTGLDEAVRSIEAQGGRAHGHILNAIEPGAIESLVAEIEATVGDIEVATYNLGAQIGNVSLQDTSLKKFEQGWRLGCEGLFRLAQAVSPHMATRGSGTILATSATAALRGNRGQHSHAAAMGGRRMLCQSLGHELGPSGIHVCHVVIDGAVNAPDTLGRMVGPDTFARIQAQGDRILAPEHIADTYYHVASQHRSVWTNELDLRPYSEQPWYTSGSAPSVSI